MPIPTGPTSLESLANSAIILGVAGGGFWHLWKMLKTLAKLEVQIQLILNNHLPHLELEINELRRDIAELRGIVIHATKRHSE